MSFLQVIGVLLAGGMVWWWLSGGWVETSAPATQQIFTKVSNDAVRQYEMVKRQGDPIQICVHAQQVAAAYLQAQDEVGYSQWSATAKSDCKRAGVPM